MNSEAESLLALVRSDKRYSLEAYLFIRESLAWAADNKAVESDSEVSCGKTGEPKGRHVTGQQLCEGIRQFAVHQFGYLAKLVLNEWGLKTTRDFGNVVYNMIDAGIMRKSSEDRKKHFDNVFDFDDVFVNQFRLCCSGHSHRCSGASSKSGAAGSSV